MKRFFSISLCLLFIILLSTPVVFALSYPEDFVSLDLDDYFVSSEFDDNGIKTSAFRLPVPDNIIFRYNAQYGLLDSNSYSFTNATGSTVYNNGFYVGYCDPLVGVDSSFDSYKGKSLVDVSEYSVGSVVSLEFPFNFAFDYSKSQGFNFVASVSLFDALGNELDVPEYDRYLSLTDSSSSSSNCTVPFDSVGGSFLGQYEISFELPASACYMSVGFSLQFAAAFNGVSYSFGTGDCILTISGAPPAVSPTYNINWGVDGRYYDVDETPVAMTVYATDPGYGSLSYQWYSGRIETLDYLHPYGYGTVIDGATSASLIPYTAGKGLFYYYCVITHTSGSSVMYSVTEPECMVTVGSTDIGGDGDDGGDSGGSGDGSGSDGGGGSSTDPTSGSGGGSGSDGDGSSDPTSGSDDGSGDNVDDGSDNETHSFLETIIDGILNLPELLLDGIKGLFVPDADAMAAYKDQWEVLLAKRFGAVYESGQLISDFASSLEASEEKGTITFPKVEIDLVGVPFSFGGWEVQVVPDGFEILVEALKKIISIIATLAFLNAMRYKFEGILGGSSA